MIQLYFFVASMSGNMFVSLAYINDGRSWSNWGLKKYLAISGCVLTGNRWENYILKKAALLLLNMIVKHCLNYCLPFVVDLCKCYCVLHSITVDTFKKNSCCCYVLSWFKTVDVTKLSSGDKKTPQNKIWSVSSSCSSSSLTSFS